MNICIYGASSDAIDPVYLKRVEVLGENLAKRGHGLVFGAGAKGVMGAAARGFHKAGGNIKGVAPTFFNVDGILFEHCTEFVPTETMRERKQIMEDSADGFIIAPGGIGTFEEFFEILTLKQLGRHAKPIAIYNVNGYYDAMLAMLNKSVKENFMREVTLDLYKVFDDDDAMIHYLENSDEELVDVVKMKIF
ncbi:MAG: TIGR00730 family Rossman fold protein [Clostridia bacterium]|nr:TIGR00730 family Rossman fold protein [Clostridia bacterium]MBR2414544.1 TIGR00730 family Rossman fold protein [Clostridia bacterium]